VDGREDADSRCCLALRCRSTRTIKGGTSNAPMNSFARSSPGSRGFRDELKPDEIGTAGGTRIQPGPSKTTCPTSCAMGDRSKVSALGSIGPLTETMTHPADALSYSVTLIQPGGFSVVPRCSLAMFRYQVGPNRPRSSARCHTAIETRCDLHYELCAPSAFPSVS
jgi:hypothetical protein